MVNVIKNNPMEVIWKMDKTELTILRKINDLAEGKKQDKGKWMTSLKKCSWTELNIDTYSSMYDAISCDNWYGLKLGILDMLNKMGYAQYEDSNFYTIQGMDLSKMFK